MELCNAEQEELEKVVSWTPITPGKCLPASPEFNSNAELKQFVLVNSPDNSQNKDVESCAVLEERSKVLSGLDNDSQSAFIAPSTPIQKGNPRKKQSDSSDLNDRPQKKPRRRKHTPKIFDESKPKKTPKPKIKPLTPKPGNSKASARSKRKIEKDNCEASYDLSENADWQAPSSTILGTIPESLVLKTSTPQPDILEHAMTTSSPPKLEHNIHTDPGHDVKSCRRALDFNLDDENDVTSGGGEELTRDHSINSFNKLLANPLDTVNEQAVDPSNFAAKVHKQLLDLNLAVLEKDEGNHATHASRLKANANDDWLSPYNISNSGLEDNLEAKSAPQPNQGKEACIYQNDHRASEHHFLKVYKRRTEVKLGMMLLTGNEVGIDQNDKRPTNQTGCRDRFLKVYRRKTRSNFGSTSLAINFPIICKKKRTKRRRPLAYVLNAHCADKSRNTLDTPMMCKVTSSEKRRYRRRGVKRATKKRLKIAKRDKNGCFTISKRAASRHTRVDNDAETTCFSTTTLGEEGKLKSHLVRELLPTEYQIAAAMADPESFKCVFGLSPMAKSRRKRSIHSKRTKSACREENTDVEALSFDLTLSPVIMSKRERSKCSRKSTTILDPFCLNSEINGINEIESSIDKSACNEIQECPQHDQWPRTEKLACDEIQECQQHEDMWPKEKSPCNEIQECMQHEGMWPKDKSAWNEIHECPQHEDQWPRTDKLACTEIQEYQQHEDMWLKEKSLCDEIQECLQHEDLCPRTEGSTDLEPMVASLIKSLQNIRISSVKVHRRRLATIKKSTTYDAAGQLVVWNPFAHKGKYKPLRQKSAKVDIDTESLRVWNLLIENKGEIDEDLDKEKEIWWEEQRKLFQGRAASFIARMRLVLGDRRFSQWKGSVVDSVVGVYLTQNVSDHLSSNAFMLLASAFPPQNKQEMTSPQGQLLLIREGMPDSVESEVSANQKDHGCVGSSQSPMSTSTCRSITDEVDDRNTSKGLSTSYTNLTQVGDCINERWHGTPEEKNLGVEDTCGSQVVGASCSSEAITSANSGDLGNEAVNLHENISRKKDKLPKRENDWDELRKTYSTGRSSGLTERSRDSVNWEAVRHADVEKIAEPIKSRGQSNVLAAKIKNFLNRLVEDHGSLDLEWLRDVPHDKAKEYLLSIHGIGPKSVDCVRLLTLRHLAFPVDINVARIAVRLGWVPLQPLPDGVLMHLLEKYPLESSIQKYLWPRLCKLDLLTLYELHYLMITFGKVFCTKRSPNCNACPMRAECRHFASAFASTRLRLPGPQQKGVATFKQPVGVNEVPNMFAPSPALSLSSRSFLESRFQTQDCEPIIEMPVSPEHKPLESLDRDIEDFPSEVEHEQEIPTIRLNTEEFRENVLNLIDQSSSREFQENVLNFVDKISTLHRDEEVSKALVLSNPESASGPARKLKSESRLRTEHLVYELPDSHPLLSGFEKREPDDPCPYLLSICRTEEVVRNQGKVGNDFCSKNLEQCDTAICSGSASYSENDQIVYGTILIPCRTANRGSFPLNGTYFQVNEVFADHESSKNPIPVPRSSIWHLRQKTLFCGTSVKTIHKDMETKDIQYCFWRGFICIRGYDRNQRAPRPLHDQFHSGSKSYR